MTERDGISWPSLCVMYKKFLYCSKNLHAFPGKSGILISQSGSNEEKLMPRQSLRITRRLTCDTLRSPKRGRMTYRRLNMSRLIFYANGRRFVTAAALLMDHASAQKDHCRFQNRQRHSCRRHTAGKTDRPMSAGALCLEKSEGIIPEESD